MNFPGGQPIPGFGYPQQETATPQVIQQLAEIMKKKKANRLDAIYGIVSSSLGGLPVVGGLLGPGGLGRLHQSKEAGGLGVLNR